MKIDAATTVLQATLAIPAAAQPAPVAQTNPPDHQARQPSPPIPGGAGDQISVNITVPKQTLDTIEKISTVTDFLNSTAKNLRETGTALKQSSDLMTQMKTELGKIIKNFPPFPPESSERRDILMSYQAIREQIDKMTIPPPPAPVYERVQAIWKDLIPAGKDTIETPALSQNASDTQVKQADEQLTFTRVAVTQLRGAIGASLQD